MVLAIAGFAQAEPPYWPPSPIGGKPLTVEPPREIEGVYAMDKVNDVAVHITLLLNLRTNTLNLTVARQGSNSILFFLPSVEVYKNSETEFVVEGSGADYNMTRSFVTLSINVSDKKISGRIESNLIRDGKSFALTGTKLESVYELLQRSGDRSCGKLEDYIGSFDGNFSEIDKAKLNIFYMKDKNNEKVLAANLLLGETRILYHDGFFSEKSMFLTLDSDVTFASNGRARKMLLVCDQDEDNFILHGIHVASTGNIVKNILFKKPKVEKEIF